MEQPDTTPHKQGLCVSHPLLHTPSVTDLLQGMVVSAGLALPCYEGPGGELVVVEQADDHHHHHCHHHDDDDDLNKLQFSCKKKKTHKKREREGLRSIIQTIQTKSNNKTVNKTQRPNVRETI